MRERQVLELDLIESDLSVRMEEAVEGLAANIVKLSLDLQAL